MIQLKSIMAAIPLVMGLAMPALASLSDSGEGIGPGGTPASIDGLFNLYAGLAPGDPDSAAVTQTVRPSLQLSAFTRAVAPMSSGYTFLGSDRITSYMSTAEDSGSVVRTSDAAAPSVATITVARHISDSLVSSVGGLSPSSTGASSSGPLVLSGVTPTATYTTTITPILPTLVTTITPIPQPVPIPPAAFLLASGLAFLAPLRQRLRAAVA